MKMQNSPFAENSFAHARKTDLIVSIAPPPPESIGYVILHSQEVRRKSHLAFSSGGVDVFA